jgi:hypothetical protein
MTQKLAARDNCALFASTPSYDFSLVAPIDAGYDGSSVETHPD